MKKIQTEHENKKVQQILNQIDSNFISLDSMMSSTRVRKYIQELKQLLNEKIIEVYECGKESSNDEKECKYHCSP